MVVPNLDAQILFEPGSKPGIAMGGRFQEVWDDQKAPRLRCRVYPIPPRLSFSFKYWSGFEVTLPAQEVVGVEGNRLVTAFRVRPRQPGAAWTHFFQEATLPEIPAGKKVDLSYGGGFFAGVGKYEVDWLLIERDGKVCRHSWNFSASAVRKVEMATPPNAITSVRLESWEGFKATPQAASEATVLIHAAPIIRRRYVTKLSPWDRTILLTSLKSVLDQVNLSRVRVVVFDVDGRRELFRSADFQPREYRRLFGILERADFGTIDYTTLSTGPSAGEFLFGLVEKEIAAARGQPVIFLGPEMRPSNARLPERQAEVKLDAGKMFYLCFPLSLADPEDLIAKIVKGKGKSYRLFYPQDLAAAIRQVNQRLAEP